MRGFLFAGLLMACAHQAAETKEAPPSEPEKQVMVADEPGLKVLADPDDAELVVDGQSYGKVSALTGPLSLKPGIYQVSLKRAGYQTWRAEVAVEQKTEQLRVVMVKQ